MKLSDLLDRFEGVAPDGDGWVAICPSHTDSHPSLRLAMGEKGFIVKCRARCETSEVLREVGLRWRDLFDVEGVADVRRATSTSLPAGPDQIAALKMRLDAYAFEITNYGVAAEDGGPHAGAIAALEYAEERFGLGYADAVRLGLGYADDLGGGPRLVVPFRNERGVALGYQARALDADAAVRWIGAKSPEGASWSKVGYFPSESGWSEVIVAEGPGDALTACAAGYSSIAIRGASLASNAEVVDEVARLVGDGVAVIAGDGDASGDAFSATLAEGLLARGVPTKILEIPPGEDLTSWRAIVGSRFATELARAVAMTRESTPATAVLSARDLRDYPLTDLGNARFVRDFVRAQGSAVRYSPEAGFYLLDVGVWRMDKLDRTRTYVQDAALVIAEIARTMIREAGTDPAAIKEAKAWGSWAKHSQSKMGIDAAVRELQALAEVATDVNDFDRHAHLLAVRNGVVNLRTGALQSHDPDLLLTRRIDLDFDPGATAPRWERFLEEVFPEHAPLTGYARRLVGYGITGETREQAFAVLYGTGANGKSVFTDTLTEVFREISVTTPFSTFEDRASGGIPNDLAALKGARLVFAAEGEQGRPMAEAILKRVTGRDLISARFMRKEFFEFRPTFLLLLATNYKPAFRGQDEGLWRRVKLVPWDRYFRPAERDHTLGDRLLDEAPGILAWAVRGASEWYADGLQDPDVIRTGTVEYRETSDALTGFMPGVFTKELDAVTKGSILWEAYLRWADDESLPQRERWTRKTFFSALEERGLEKRKRSSGIVFVGVRKARLADHLDDHDVPETDDEAPRAEVGTLAPASPEAPTQGADVGAVY